MAASKKKKTKVKTKIKTKKPAAKSKSAPAKKTVKVVAKPQKQSAKASRSVAKKPLEKAVSLTPVRDGVLVERIVESDRTPGGLYIPASAVDKPLKGVVVNAGRGKVSKRGRLHPLDVQKGDEVMFGKFAGTEVSINGKDYLLIREDEILGVVS